MRPRTIIPALCLLTIATACSSSGSTSTATVASTVAGPAVTAATSTSPPAVVTTTASAATTAVSTEAATTEASKIATVEIADFKFGPADLHVPTGASVTWTNSDAQNHTVTASGAFDLGSIDPKGTATQTFDTAGTFAYICAFHPFMKGTVVVG